MQYTYYDFRKDYLTIPRVPYLKMVINYYNSSHLPKFQQLLPQLRKSKLMRLYIIGLQECLLPLLITHLPDTLTHLAIILIISEDRSLINSPALKSYVNLTHFTLVGCAYFRNIYLINNYILNINHIIDILSRSLIMLTLQNLSGISSTTLNALKCSGLNLLNCDGSYTPTNKLKHLIIHNPLNYAKYKIQRSNLIDLDGLQYLNFYLTGYLPFNFKLNDVNWSRDLVNLYPLATEVCKCQHLSYLDPGPRYYHNYKSIIFYTIAMIHQVCTWHIPLGDTMEQWADSLLSYISISDYYNVVPVMVAYEYLNMEKYRSVVVSRDNLKYLWFRCYGVSKIPEPVKVIKGKYYLD